MVQGKRVSFETLHGSPELESNHKKKKKTALKATDRADKDTHATKGHPYCAEARNVECVVRLLTEPVKETLIWDSLLCLAACSWDWLWS